MNDMTMLALPEPQTIETKELITPAIAKRLMGRNTKNRVLRPRHVKHLAGAMARGEWKYNGCTICLSEDGTLLDGQHRLSAIIESGVPQYFIVVRGISDDAFGTFDQGVGRTVGDAFRHSGESNVNSLAAAARAILIVESGGAAAFIRPTTAEHFAVLKAHPSLRRWDAFSRNEVTLRRFFGAYLSGIACLFAEKYGDDAIDRFMTQLATGENIRKGDPAYELRNRAILNKTAVAKLRQLTMMQLVIKAMKAFVTGKKIGVLRVSPGDEFPSI
jgi:hypothetical protein